MQELLAQLYGYVLGVWRFRWSALAVAWILATGGWIWVGKMPESYLATARVDVDSNTVLRPLLRGLAIQPDVNQRVALMSRTLLNRPNLEKLMRMADLDLNVKSDLEEERLLDKIKENIRLSGERQNSSLYSLSFKHEDRETAKRIVQSLITIFIESTLGEKRKDSSGAQVFLDQQIAEYEVRLSDSETRLADFKQRNVGTIPGETGGYYQRLEVAKNQLSSANLQLSEMKNRRNEINRQLDGEEPVFLSSSTMGIDAFSPIDQRIQALRKKLDDLSLTYTERHPVVIQVRSMIKELEDEKLTEMEKAVESQPSGLLGLQNSPVYQQMRTMLAETEANIAELKVRVTEYKKRVKVLEKTINSIPDIEVELQQLDRDYKVVSQQHAALLKRRESAMLSEKVEQNTDGVKFRVIDPPFVPLKPTEPNKLILNSGVFGASLAAGGGMAFVLSLIFPVFFNRSSLAEVTHLPVLGSVMIVLSKEQKRTEFYQKAIFISLTLFLVMVFAGVNIGQNLYFA